MGFFSNLYGMGKPGPGVNPDEPRKKGLARYWEIMSRDFGRFFGAGILAFVGLFPYFAGLSFAITSHAVLVLLPCAVLGGMIAAPQINALTDTVLRSLRDEPGYWWHTYRKTWKRDAKASLLPGALTGLVYGMQIFTFAHMPTENNTVFLIVLLMGIFLATGVFVWLWAQLPLLTLGFWPLLKNSILLFLGQLPRSLGAVVIWLGYALAIALFFPLSVPVLLFTNLWLPATAGLLAFYRAMDATFHIEEEIKNKRQ